jgi:hypothetical protein
MKKFFDSIQLEKGDVKKQLKLQKKVATPSSK